LVYNIVWYGIVLHSSPFYIQRIRSRLDFNYTYTFETCYIAQKQKKKAVLFYGTNIMQF